MGKSEKTAKHWKNVTENNDVILMSVWMSSVCVCLVTIPISCVVVSVLCEACHIHCVCGGWHSPTHCPAVHHPLCSSLSVPLSSTTITQKTHGVCGEKRGRKEEERSDAKTSGKKGAKREKEITTPGVPRLSPTLVLTRPKQASLH